jgi:hypothetical protein
MCTPVSLHSLDIAARFLILLWSHCLTNLLCNWNSITY